IRRIDWDNGLLFDRLLCAAVVPQASQVVQSLEVLSLCGQKIPGRNWQHTPDVRLPRLHTLWTDTLYYFGPQIWYDSECNTEFPALRRIVINNPVMLDRLIDRYLGAHRPYVHAVKIGKHFQSNHSKFMLYNPAFFSTIMRNCPYVKTLHYPILWTQALEWPKLQSNVRFYNLRLIGLYLSRDTCIMADELWRKVEDHINALLGNQKFPFVQKIELHGADWAPFLSSTRFHTVLYSENLHGVKISCKDQVAALALKQVIFSY
ncbi:hypothetical protein DFH11DRAFT_1769719, partial [Phellopilus nigrolimitatus]